MNRDRFKEFVLDSWGWEDIDLMGLFTDTEPFWTPEVSSGWQAGYFCECWPRVKSSTEFYNWNQQNLSRYPLCYMSDLDSLKEWWGFATEEDLMMFLLRWA